MSELAENVDRALEQFAQRGADIDRRAVAPLLTTAGAAPAAKDERFGIGVDKFLDYIHSNASGRVQTLALLWRLTSVSAMREHRRKAVRSIQSGVPPFGELPAEMSDPDDRRHFGDAVSNIEQDWLPAYLARSIVHEREGEKAREALARALVSKRPVLSDQLSLIAEALAEVRFEQQDPSVGRARRLASVLDALAAAAWTAEHDVEPGATFGANFERLITEVLGRHPPGERAVALSSAESVLAYVIQAVRLHGTLAAEARTYAFLVPLRRSLGSSQWPSELSQVLTRAAGQILEQLLFLVRLGMPDSDLRGLYLSIVGEGVGKARFSAIADQTAGLNPDHAHWLKTGSFRKALPTQSAIEETAVSAVDRDLGLAFRESGAIASAVAAIEGEAIAAAEFHSPRLGEDVKSVFDRFQKLCAHVAAAARRRNLVLRGTPGEVVAFAPAEHEPDSSAVGARTVRRISPSVERVIDGQTVSVVVKGDVASV